MTVNELEQREREIKSLIYHYRMQSMDLQQQIVMNEKEICKLNNQLTELHYQFKQAYQEETQL